MKKGMSSRMLQKDNEPGWVSHYWARCGSNDSRMLVVGSYRSTVIGVIIGVRLDNWVYRDIKKASWLASLASITLAPPTTSCSEAMGETRHLLFSL